MKMNPDSKVHGANTGPIWGRQDPGGPHVGPMNFAIWDIGIYASSSLNELNCFKIIVTFFSVQWVKEDMYLYILYQLSASVRYRLLNFILKSSAEYSRGTRSIQWLLIPWLLVLPVHILLFLHRFVAQIPECTSPISHNTPFCIRNVHVCGHFCYKILQCRIFVRCIVRFVTWAYWNRLLAPIRLSVQYTWDATGSTTVVQQVAVWLVAQH